MPGIEPCFLSRTAGSLDIMLNQLAHLCHHKLQSLAADIVVS